ncbi:hypothetical protein [Nocardia sp. NPDC050793]|uniref:hypothetical protein n=1 Tax=Nocardia sp. NPDC050793 TaxID=3155159 RepID=UPI0033CFF58D
MLSAAGAGDSGGVTCDASSQCQGATLGALASPAGHWSAGSYSSGAPPSEMVTQFDHVLDGRSCRYVKVKRSRTADFTGRIR